MTRRGTSFLRVVPNLLDMMSISFGVAPSGRFQANEWRREASIRCTMREARGKPGQVHWPAPNGMKSKPCPLKSCLEQRNLLGSKVVGLSHVKGSLSMAHAQTKIRESSGTLNPPIFTLDKALRGRRSGGGGWRRRVSFMIASR